MLFKYLGYILIGVAVFTVSYFYNKRFLEWLRFQSLGTRDYIHDKFSVMFIDIPANQILLTQFIISFGLGIMVFLAFLPGLFPGIPLGIFVTIIGWKLPKPIVDFMYRKRVGKFVLQMIDGLALMSNGLKSGLSIAQSMEMVTREMPNPIKQEFQLILNQNKLGVTLEEAFVNLSKRIESDDVEMFVTSVNILKETGGNLAETFDTIVSTIRERIKVENKIDALTAQGFYQGMVVMAVPPGLFITFFQSDPEFMMPLVSTPLGWMILFIIMGLELLGFFIIMKIVKIQV